MKFSVLMSVYYKENPNYLKQAIESVLNQSLKPSEIVIIKDGPLTEELDAILEGYKREYESLFKIVPLEKNCGLGVALKRGVLECSHNIIARMDTDDISRKDRFEKQIEVIEKGDIDIVGSNIAEFYGDISNILSERKVPRGSEEIKNFAKKRNPFNHMTVMYKKDSILKAGNYNSFLWFEDYNLWIRMLMNNFKFYNIQENLVYARTGLDMFSRRGGMKYIKQEINMQRFMLENKVISTKEYLVNVTERILVRVIPNKIRGLVYIRLLRR